MNLLSATGSTTPSGIATFRIFVWCRASDLTRWAFRHGFSCSWLSAKRTKEHAGRPHRLQLSPVVAILKSSNRITPGSADMIRDVGVTTDQPEIQSKIEPLLLEVADVVNTTLDLDTTLRRVAELVRKVIDYEIFAILLLNERTQELRFRFQIGYPREYADRARIKVGQGVTGRSAQTRQAVLVEDVTKDPDAGYIEAVPNVRSELAVPLIIKNRLIGVIDLEAREAGYFTEEHSRLLTLIASRMAVGIENAQLYTRSTRQARTLLLLNEIARELTSILNVDELLKRIAELLNRIIDYQMFSVLLLDPGGEMLSHRFSLRFQE